MRKGTVLSFKGFDKIFDFVLKNRVFLVLTVFFIFGFLLGVFNAEKNETLNAFNTKVLEGFIESRSGKSFLQIAVKSFLNSMLFILFGFACGSSVLGLIFVPFCTGFKGFLYGGTAALLYSLYSLKGIAFYTVIILPAAIVFLFGFLFVMRESFEFSFLLTRLTLPQTLPVNISLQFRNYCIKYLFATFIIVFSAITDALLCGNFLNVFSLE